MSSVQLVMRSPTRKQPRPPLFRPTTSLIPVFSSTERCPSLAQISERSHRPHRQRAVKNLLRFAEIFGEGKVHHISLRLVNRDPAECLCACVGWAGDVNTTGHDDSVKHGAVYEDQLEVLQPAHSECFESTTVHFIVLIISRRGETPPLSRC